MLIYIRSCLLTDDCLITYGLICLLAYLLLMKFIHSDHFYCTSSSPLLLRSAPDTAQILCRSFTPKRLGQLWIKDLPMVPTWRLEWESNPWPSGWKLSTQPMRYHVPQIFERVSHCVFLYCGFSGQSKDTMLRKRHFCPTSVSKDIFMCLHYDWLCWCYKQCLSFIVIWGC